MEDQAINAMMVETDRWWRMNGGPYTADGKDDGSCGGSQALDGPAPAVHILRKDDDKLGFESTERQQLDCY